MISTSPGSPALCLPARSPASRSLAEGRRFGEGRGEELHPPTQETTALAVEECVTLDGKANTDYSTMLRRISLTGG